MFRSSSLAASVGLAATLTVISASTAPAQTVPGSDKGTVLANAPSVPTAPPEVKAVPLPPDSNDTSIRPAPPADARAAPPPAEADRTPAEPAAATAPPPPAASETVNTTATPPPADADEPAPAPAAATEPPPPGPPTTANADPTPPVVEIDPLLAEVRQQLSASKLRNVPEADRTALEAFYGEKTSATIWVTADGFTARARDAMAEIAKADDWGLDARAFVLPAAVADRSPAALAGAELKLSLEVLKYARHARGGRLDPSRLSRNFDQDPPLRDPKLVLQAVAATETPGDYLRDLHPKHPQFVLLRKALLDLRAKANLPQEKAENVVELPDGPTLKLDVVHPHVALLRQRLELIAPPDAENVYDLGVQEAVAEFQRKNGLHADGIVGPRTRAALNGDDGSAPAFGSEEQRLVINMERWRWMPENLGAFHVWNNIPEFHTRVVKNGRAVHRAKIVVGKRETQTAIFSANMRYVIFGPEWGVPDSIKRNEILPYLRPSFETSFFGFGGGSVTDTRVLEKHNLRVTYNGRPVDASRVDWTQVDITKYNFIQPAGPGNVLGAVKFRFPNKHHIYMHDTPQRDLFNKTVRTYSHGCMRVHNPGEFAGVLLQEDQGWSGDRVRRLMTQGAEGTSYHVTLTKEIPVHTSYFTMVVDEDGRLQSFADVYGHDRRVASALVGRPLPLEPATSGTSETRRVEAKREERRPRRVNNDDLFSGLFGN